MTFLLLWVILFVNARRQADIQECGTMLVLVLETVRTTSLISERLLFNHDGTQPQLLRNALNDMPPCLVAFGGDESPQLARAIERGLRRRGVRAVFFPDELVVSQFESFLQNKRILWVTNVISISTILMHQGWLCPDKAMGLLMPLSKGDEAALRHFANSSAQIGCSPSIDLLDVFDPGHTSIPIDGWVLPGLSELAIQRKMFRNVSHDCVVVDEYTRPILKSNSTFQLAIGACSALQERMSAGEIKMNKDKESRAGQLKVPFPGTESKPVILEETWWITIPNSVAEHPKQASTLVPLVICTRFFTVGSASMVHALADWLAWHETRVGVRNLEMHVYVFNADAETMTLLQLFTSRGSVVLHDWSPFSSHETTARTWARGQQAYLSDCFARNEIRAKSIANIDVDEFLIANNLLKALEELSASPRIHSISTFFAGMTRASSSHTSTFDRFHVRVASAAPKRSKYLFQPSPVANHNVFLLPNIHKARQLNGKGMDIVDAHTLSIAHARLHALSGLEFNSSFEWYDHQSARDLASQHIAEVARIVNMSENWDAPLIPLGRYDPLM
jgi:hypothetical protein